jgi:hypothetical protein
MVVKKWGSGGDDGLHCKHASTRRSCGSRHVYPVATADLEGGQTIIFSMDAPPVAQRYPGTVHEISLNLLNGRRKLLSHQWPPSISLKRGPWGTDAITALDATIIA